MRRPLRVRCSSVAWCHEPTKGPLASNFAPGMELPPRQEGYLSVEAPVHPPTHAPARRGRLRATAWRPGLGGSQELRGQRLRGEGAVPAVIVHQDLHRFAEDGLDANRHARERFAVPHALEDLPLLKDGPKPLHDGLIELRGALGLVPGALGPGSCLLPSLDEARRRDSGLRGSSGTSSMGMCSKSRSSSEKRSAHVGRMRRSCRQDAVPGSMAPERRTPRRRSAAAGFEAWCACRGQPGRRSVGLCPARDNARR